MKKTQFKGVIILLLTAFIWGSSFVAQSVGMDSVDAFTFNGVRTLLGAAVLLPFIFIKDMLAKKKLSPEERKGYKIFDRKTLIYGSVLGVILCIATNLQQFAFYHSDSGKIAFITAFYMFFVPVFGLFIRKRVPFITWLCVAGGCVGMYFLCIDPSTSAEINPGDILAFICSIFFALQILAIEKFAPDVDGIKLSCIQFIVSGLISCILMFIFEEPNVGNLLNAAVPLMYSGFMSCGVAYTLQIVGQKYTEATLASLIMCLEAVFGVLCGAVLLHEILSGREIFGCIIMFISIVLSQLSELITARLKENKLKADAKKASH
ncbi:MAG: DMT family transporter [Clostridia bacterium]|nr:DMT family transporter [Clostridia bacterium]